MWLPIFLYVSKMYKNEQCVFCCFLFVCFYLLNSEQKINKTTLHTTNIVY